MTRCFVPATLDDNPALTSRDPSYRNRLRAIRDPRKREALELGDWDAIEQVDGALWEQVAALDDGRVRTVPESINRRIIAIDPSDGDESADGFGVTVACLGENGKGYVEWNDEWHEPPQVMARKVIELYREVGAGVVIIEKNHGGKWIPALLKTLDPTINTDLVWASEGKRLRAEPISALFYEQDGFPRLVHMVGVHPELEDELTSYTGKPGEPSRDRLDSMVWAMTELMRGYPVLDIDTDAHQGQSLTGDLLSKAW